MNSPRSANGPIGSQPVTSTVAEPRFQARLRRRYASERRFQWVGRIALALGGAFLALILGTIVANGYTAWQQTFIALEIHFDPERLDPEGTGHEEVLLAGDYGGLVKAALRKEFPEVRKRRERRKLQALISPGASFHLRDMVLEEPDSRRRDPDRLAARGRRRRHAPQGAHRPHRPRGLAAAERSPARDRGRARRERSGREALQPRLLHGGRLARAGDPPAFTALSSAPPSPSS